MGLLLCEQRQSETGAVLLSSGCHIDRLRARSILNDRVVRLFAG